MTAPMTAPQRQFVVMPADEDFPGQSCRLVSAPNEEEAIAKYVERVLARDDAWLANIYTKATFDSFAEMFYQEAGVPLLDEQGEWTCTAQEARHIFEVNVRRFFGAHEDWADHYLTFYTEDNSRSWREAMARWRFPAEMVGYMLRHAGQSWCDIVAIDLASIERVD